LIKKAEFYMNYPDRQLMKGEVRHESFEEARTSQARKEKEAAESLELRHILRDVKEAVFEGERQRSYLLRQLELEKREH
jgi:hypothetical protein